MTTTCRHGIDESLCAMCRNSGYVFISAGGSSYHQTDNCKALIQGQDRVEKSGGTPASIERVPLASEEAAKRSPCSVCKPTRRV